MEQYPILQSGFITNTMEGLIRPVFVKDPFIDFTIDKDHLKNKSLNFYSAEVDDLYEVWRKTPNKLREFEFRESVLTAAYYAFNIKSIYKWIEMQSLSTKTSSIHNAFILETVSFVYGGERKVQLPQWIRLIEASREARAVKIDIDKFFDTEKYPNVVTHSNLLTDFIVSWVSQPNGFEDLLLSLYVIFGNRPYVTDVANKNVS